MAGESLDFYNAFYKHRDQGDIDLVNDTIKVMLVTSAYTFDQDTHEFVSQITNEVAGTGYTAGGQALANKSVTQDNINDRSIFDADDVTWAASEITARRAVIYKDTGTPTTSPLIACVDLGADRSTYVTNFVLQWNNTGMFVSKKKTV